jgi:hypothetical protein
MFGVNAAQLKKLQEANAKKITQKSSSPSSNKKSSKVVTNKGKTLDEVTVTAAINKRDLGKIEIIPFDKPDISKFPTTIPPRVSAIPSPINIPTLAKGNFSSFLQYAANQPQNMPVPRLLDVFAVAVAPKQLGTAQMWY